MSSVCNVGCCRTAGSVECPVISAYNRCVRRSKACCTIELKFSPTFKDSGCTARSHAFVAPLAYTQRDNVPKDIFPEDTCVSRGDTSALPKILADPGAAPNSTASRKIT